MLVQDKIAELQDRDFCVLKAQFAKSLVEACREGLWPILLAYIEGHRDQPNRGPHRQFLAMPFEPPCFAPECGVGMLTIAARSIRFRVPCGDRSRHRNRASCAFQSGTDEIERQNQIA